ncbi:hypothetical protein P7C70_g6994, partial [Phenoliferia sp. Uapishka_3]
MRLFFITAFLGFAASSALAISIITPSNWTTTAFARERATHVKIPTGPYTVTFSSVKSDPTSFAAILVNQNGTLVPSYFLLAPVVFSNTSQISFTLSTALLAGAGYQIK